MLLSYEDLQKGLREKGYIVGSELGEALFYAIHTEPVKGAFLMGPVGAGKSFLAESVAKVLNAPLFVKQVTSQTKETEFFIGHTVDEQGNVVAYDGVLLEIAKFLENNPDKYAVLLIDEIDKAHEYIDSFFLDFLQTGRIRYLGKKYDIDLKRLIVFFTSNQNRPLNEALLRRLPIIYINKPDAKLMAEILKSKGIKNENILNLALMIYEASLNVELYKPITAQELYQFCKALELAEKTQIGNLDRFIMQFLAKDLHDYEVLKLSLKGMNSFSFIKKETEKKEKESIENIVYEKINSLQNEVERSKVEVIKVEEQESKPFVLPSFPKIFKKELKPQKIKQIKYGYAIVDEKDSFDFLSNLIVYEKLKKTETDSFKLTITEPNKHFFIQKKPFTFAEIDKLLAHDFNIKGEIYVKDSFSLTKNLDKNLLIEKLLKIVKKWQKNYSYYFKVKLKYLSESSARLEVIGSENYYQNENFFNLFFDLQKENLFIYIIITNPNKRKCEFLHFLYKNIKEEINLHNSQNQKNLQQVDLQQISKEIEFFEKIVNSEKGWNYNHLQLDIENVFYDLFKCKFTNLSQQLQNKLKLEKALSEEKNNIFNFYSIHIKKENGYVIVKVNNLLLLRILDFLKRHNSIYQMIKEAANKAWESFYPIPAEIQYYLIPSASSETNFILERKIVTYTNFEWINKEQRKYWSCPFECFEKYVFSQNTTYEDFIKSLKSKSEITEFTKNQSQFKNIEEIFYKDNHFSDLLFTYKLTTGQVELLLNIVKNTIKLLDTIKEENKLNLMFAMKPETKVNKKRQSLSC